MTVAMSQVVHTLQEREGFRFSHYSNTALYSLQHE